MSRLYEFNLLEENGYKRVSIVPREYEDKVMKAYEDYIRWNYGHYPTYLVVSSLPHKALCALPFLDRDGSISLDEIKTFHGMKVIHLKRWDKDIIEVG